MADRALRGMGLGAKSFEDEEGVEFATRKVLGFTCPKGHHFEVTFDGGGPTHRMGMPAVRCRCHP